MCWGVVKWKGMKRTTKSSKNESVRKINLHQGVWISSKGWWVTISREVA